MPGSGDAPSKVYRVPARVTVAGTVVAVLLLATLAGRATGDAALTTADVVRFLRAGISERTILTELRERGFGEALDEAHEAELRAAGASETLVVAVRRAAPASKPAAAPAAPPAPERPRAEASAHAPTFAAGARTVRVPVSVLDKAGQPVLGLKSASFQVSDDGKRQAVTLFSAERRPLRIALALDISRSMDNKIRQVGAALSHFIDLLEPADEILVITFNDRVQVVQDFTSDRDQLARVLDVLEPSGGTALYDAAYTAIEKVAALPAESKAVVLVTDGVDTASATSFGTLRQSPGARRCRCSRWGSTPVRCTRTSRARRDGGGRARRWRRKRRLAGRGRWRWRRLAGRWRRRLGWRRPRWRSGGRQPPGRQAAGVRRQAPERARRRDRRAGRDRQGAGALHARDRRGSRERPTEGGGGVDRHDTAAPLSPRLRPPGEQARVADDPHRRRPSRRHCARAEGLLRRGLTPAQLPGVGDGHTARKEERETRSPRRRLGPPLVVALIALVLAAAPVSGQGPPTGQLPCQLTGRVASGGTPLPGVALTVSAAGGGDVAASSTGTDGAFVLDLPAPGAYVLHANLAGFADASAR